MLTKLLRSTERYTGTDNVYIVKNSSYLLFTQLVSVLNGFILYILIARLLPQEVYGVYKYFLSLFSLFAVFTITGTDTALIRSVANKHEGDLRTAFALRLKWGCVGSISILALAGYYWLHGQAGFSFALIGMAITAPFIYAAPVYGAFLNGKKEFSLYSRLSIFNTLFSFVVMVVGFIFIQDPVLLFFIFLFSNAPTLLFYIWVARNRSENTSSDPGLPAYSRYLSFFDVFGIVAMNIDGFLVFHFLGAKELAIYSIALIPVEQLKGFLKSFPAIAFPKFVVAPLAYIKKTIAKKLAAFTLFVAAGVLIYIALAPIFFRLFFPSYTGSVIYSQVYALSLIFLMPVAIMSALFNAKFLKKENALFQTIGYSVQIILLVIGAWKYGLWGAVVSRVIARCFMLVLTASLLLRAKEVGINQTPERKELI